MMNKLVAAALALASAGAFAADPAAMPASGNLVLDGSFESYVLPDYTWTTLYGADTVWTTGANGLELRHDIVGTAFDGANFAELDTTGNSTISQTLSTVVGQQYTLSFWAQDRAGVDAASQGLAFTVGDVAGTVAGGSVPGWTQFTRTFTATGDQTLLSFSAIGNSDSLGTSLDNIAVTPVPEPATLALMAAGLALVGVARRRQQR